MAKVFISDALVEDYASDGKYNVRFAAHLTSVNYNSHKMQAMPSQPITEATVINIQYAVKAVVKEGATNAEILQPNLKDVYVKSANETISVKLSELGIPKITLSNFKTSEELQNYLHDYYLQFMLNKLGKFGSSNWTEKAE